MFHQISVTEESQPFCNFETSKIPFRSTPVAYCWNELWETPVTHLWETFNPNTPHGGPCPHGSNGAEGTFKHLEFL